jgi:LmbE family N-acetylglucosaminyl deacetylase
MPSRNIKLMIVATHPADSFDQAGGTLAHHVARGDSVTAVVATTGVRSHHWKLADRKRQAGADVDVEEMVQEAVEEKLEEVRSACRIMGFEDIRDLGFEDDDILVTQDKIEAIADAIRDVKPDILISHHPYETGGLKMHATIGQCTVFASQIAAGSGRGRQERHNVPVIYFMNPQSYVGNNSLEYAGTGRTDLYVDITDVIDKKVKALDQISTQFYGGPYARKRAESEDGSWGQKALTAYAEQFQRLQPMVLHALPITEAELDRATTTSADMMTRRGEVVGGIMPLPEGMEYSSAQRVPAEKYQI